MDAVVSYKIVDREAVCLFTGRLLPSPHPSQTLIVNDLALYLDQNYLSRKATPRS